MTSLHIHSHPLAYERALQQRPLVELDLLVIHCTELPDLAEARSYGERVLYPDSQTGNSGHYYIDLDGRVEQWVTPERMAHHVRSYNQRSLGIELVNQGRYPHWLQSDSQHMQHPYPDEQIVALLQLLQHLCGLIPSLQWLAGHEDLDQEQVPSSNQPDLLVRRKLDPGPLFPWARVEAECSLTRLPK